MATYYVSSAASGSDDGTSPVHVSGTTGPWTFAQMLSATLAAGDQVRIMADGTYSRSATANFAWSTGTAAKNIVITGANASGIVDGSMPTIQASAGSINLVDITASYILAKYLNVDGNNQTSTTGLFVSASYSRAMFCKAQNTTVIGLGLADGYNVTSLFGCEATGCSGTCAIYAGGGQVNGVHFSESYNNNTHGFQGGAGAKCSFCIAQYNNSTGAPGGSGAIDGFHQTSVGATFCGCISYGNGRSGFDLHDNAALGTVLIDCSAYENGGEGFGTNGVCGGTIAYNCAGGSNTSGNYNATNLTIQNFVSLSADPFLSAAAGNFALNSTAGAGASCRAAGYGIMPRGTRFYPDIGLQHHDSGGGGGSPYVGIIGGW